ncbi:MAG: 3-keto-disaccharide hydrolase [Daejeonella sp.]|uniref:3-keto-disaccharide hydrolase n=1 Tax=Daejeonella sp. JGW-45 TaxID=3034148 RepID=UPI0023EB124F|nr:DUF1080 domain-containing protein [Daejeonella sp. JGW-45]
MTRKINKIRGSLVWVILILLLTLASYKMVDSPQDGFVTIFDGKTLDGWEGDPKYWRAEDGNIVGEITPNTLPKRNTFLIWRGGMPADFELILEFKITKAGNSGINYRSEELKDVPFVLKGYQLDIDGSHRYIGQNYEERGRTTLAYRGQKTIIKAQDPGNSAQAKVENGSWSGLSVTGSLGEPDALSQKIKSEDWNTCRLVARGNRLQHYINGVLMSDVTDNDTKYGRSKGVLGLQVHVGPPMKVEYRKIRIKQ